MLRMIGLAMLACLAFVRIGFADTVVTFQPGVTKVPADLLYGIKGHSYTVKGAWDAPRFVLQSVPRTPWEKAMRSASLALLIKGDWASTLSTRSSSLVASVQRNEPFPEDDEGFDEQHEPPFPEPQCGGVIYAFHHYSEADQKLESDTSCDVFAIRPNGGFNYRIELRSSTPKRFEVFEHGVKVASGSGSVVHRFNWGTRQRYITVSGAAGAYHLQVYPIEADRGAEKLLRWNLSDVFSNGYGFGIPNGEKLGRQPPGRTEWIGARMMGAESLWQAGHTGRGVKVAVVDTGIAHDHPFLQGSVTGGFTPFGGGTSPEDYDDVQGHGSHVAGIIKQVAPDVEMLAVRVFSSDDGGTTPEMIEQGVRWAIDNGAKVVNLSLGGLSAPRSWENVFRYGVERGVLFAVSSGNERGFVPLFPAVFAGSIPGFGFSVGALDSVKNLAVFSNWTGDNLNMKQVSAHGVRVSSVDYSSNGLVNQSGTSMAAPQIAGHLALLRQAYPTASNAEIVSKVTENVRRAAIND